MAITDKLKAIGNAIREKSGKSALLTLDDMPTEIKALGGIAEKLKASEYPDYITPEVIKVVNKVNAVKTDESIVFLAMSDSHYCSDEDISAYNYETETNASAVQANQAAKAMAYLLDVDFFAHLGDVSSGSSETTPEMLKKQIEEFNAYFCEAKSDFPVFICIGNHDTGIYYHDKQTDGKIHTLDGVYLFNNFTAYSASDNTVFGGEENGGYCYRDFEDKKLRVIMLNTSEKLVTRQIDNTTFGAQRLWLANTLLDLNSKENATEWKFIILCHYPADYGATMPLSELLRAYVDGVSFTIVDPADSDYYKGDGTNATVDFAGANNATFIAQFHGHIHNFLTSKLHVSKKQTDSTFIVTEYDAWRMCIPNGQFNRENIYGTYSGIDFSEDKSYPKTADTAKGTSFVVNVINPSEQKIYLFCYGAGYDRVIGYGDIRIYNISSTLNNVSISNEAISIEEGQEYSATLTTADNYSIDTVTVKMGGVDITATAYSDGEIYIEAVTGNIIIEATAVFDFKGKNELAISTDTDGSIYNGKGYKEKCYLSGGKVVDAASMTVFTSGFIPCKQGDTLYFKNCQIRANQGYDRFCFYDTNKSFPSSYPQYSTSDNYSQYFSLEFGEDGYAESMTINSVSFLTEGGYLRFCCRYLGADSIVAKEPII